MSGLLPQEISPVNTQDLAQVYLALEHWLLAEGINKKGRVEFEILQSDPSSPELRTKVIIEAKKKEDPELVGIWQCAAYLVIAAEKYKDKPFQPLFGCVTNMEK